MEEMQWIEDIVKSTRALPFLTNCRVGMVAFVNPHKVVARKNAFSALPSAQNGGELEGEVSKEEEKHFFFLNVKKGKKKRPKVNLILSHVNHTFFILDPQIGLHTYKHTHRTLRKKCFLKM